MSPEEARLHARELLRRARAGDSDAAHVLVDVLAMSGYERLAEDLALAFRGETRTYEGGVRPVLFRDTPQHVAEELERIEEHLFSPEERREMRSGEEPSPSTMDTRTIESRLRTAATRWFGRGRTRPFFQNGRWWLEDRDGAVYAVVDAVDADLGFQFQRAWRGVF